MREREKKVYYCGIFNQRKTSDTVQEPLSKRPQQSEQSIQNCSIYETLVAPNNKFHEQCAAITETKFNNKCGQDQINFHFHPTNMPVTLPEFVSNDCARCSLYDRNSLVPEGNVTV